MKKITVPGSKSISNRALILAAISNKSTILKNLLECDDVRYLRNALANFGVKFEKLSKKEWKVIPPGKLKGNNSDNFIGNGGTPARFLTTLSALVEGSFALRGVERMHERPFGDLFKAVGELGVRIEYLGEEGYLPARFEEGCEGCSQNPSQSPLIKGRSIIEISGKTSSQFLSGLLLVASRIDEGLEIKITDKILSRPYVEMTLEMLKIWGVRVDVSGDFTYFRVYPDIKSPGTYTIPADCSSASYPIAFSILDKQPISIVNFGTRTLQGDERFLDVAKKCGAKIKRVGEKVEIIPPDKILPLGKIDFSKMPDVSMTGMILAAFATGKSHFIGLESLRVKECDRIKAMAEGLQHLEVSVEVMKNEIKIVGNQKSKIKNYKLKIKSYEDHRIAMVFGVVKTVLGLDFEITNPECVAKSWPDFWLELANWSGELREVAGVILSRPYSTPLKEFLIVRKPRKDHAWQFPQGGIDKEETLIVAAKRELKEECGEDMNVRFLDNEPVGVYKYLFPKNFKRHDSEITGARVSFFRAEYLGGKVEIDGKEIVEYKWIKEEEFGEFFDEKYLLIMRYIING